mgnify:CR=1 FL=1
MIEILNSIAGSVYAKKAAMYVRMSTDNQKYSIEHQSAIINEYAKDKGMLIIETFADEGKSGLTYNGRDALKRLIQMVQAGQATFTIILVLDVSRWGRFQDIDESAYYEFICRKSGIEVHYVAEQFPNQNDPMYSLYKTIKRIMAGEYSRELSAKVTRGKRKLLEKGFRQGGTAGYGFRRGIVDSKGNLKRIIERDEYKSNPTERVILVPGPKSEIKTVTEIYNYFVKDDMGEAEIVRMLNAKGIKTDRDRFWTAQTVKGVLINEKYIGHSINYQQSYKLRAKAKMNPPEKWLRVENAFEAIIDKKLFAKAQIKRAKRKIPTTKEEMLSDLCKLKKRCSHLSLDKINAAPETLTGWHYQEKFGSLSSAYKLIGYKPKNYEYIKLRDSLEKIREAIQEKVICGLYKINASVNISNGKDKLFKINNKIVALVVCKSTPDKQSKLRMVWKCRYSKNKDSNFIVIIRMNNFNTIPKSFYLVPRKLIKTARIRFPREHGINFKDFEYSDITSLTTALYKKTRYYNGLKITPLSS